MLIDLFTESRNGALPMNRYQFYFSLLLFLIFHLFFISCGIKGKLSGGSELDNLIVDPPGDVELDPETVKPETGFPTYTRSGKTCGLSGAGNFKKLSEQETEDCACLFNFIPSKYYDNTHPRFADEGKVGAQVLQYGNLLTQSFKLSPDPASLTNYQILDTDLELKKLTNAKYINVKNCFSNFAITLKPHSVSGSMVATLDAEQALVNLSDIYHLVVDITAPNYCTAMVGLVGTNGCQCIPKNESDLWNDDYSRYSPSGSIENYGLLNLIHQENKKWDFCLGLSKGSLYESLWKGELKDGEYADFSTSYYAIKSTIATYGNRCLLQSITYNIDSTKLTDTDKCLSYQLDASGKLKESTSGTKTKCVSHTTNFNWLYALKELDDNLAPNGEDQYILDDDCSCNFAHKDACKGDANCEKQLKESINAYFGPEYFALVDLDVSKVCKARIASVSATAKIDELKNNVLTKSGFGISTTDPDPALTGCVQPQVIFKPTLVTAVGDPVAIYKNISTKATDVENCGCTFYNDDGKIEFYKSGDLYSSQLKQSLQKNVEAYFLKPEVAAACKKKYPTLEPVSISKTLADKMNCKIKVWSPTGTACR